MWLNMSAVKWYVSQYDHLEILGIMNLQMGILFLDLTPLVEHYNKFQFGLKISLPNDLLFLQMEKGLAHQLRKKKRWSVNNLGTKSIYTYNVLKKLCHTCVAAVEELQL